MASVIPAMQPGLPTRLQIALAIAIVKSKPEDITVRDYILHLRSYIKQGTRPTRGDGGHLYLDLVSYWKARCDEAQQRCNDLERRNVQVERANDMLKTRPDIDEFLGKKPTASKRKEPGSKPTRSSKRTKLSPEISGRSVMAARGTFGSDLDILDNLGEGTESRNFTYIADESVKAGEELVLKLYNTHKLLKQRSTKPEEICVNLVETARAIGAVISMIPKNYDRLAMGNTKGLTPIEKDKSELSSVVQTSTRAFASLIVGLGKISNGVGIHLPSLVIFECVKMFKTIFDSISETARQTANIRLASQAKTNASHSRSTMTARESGPFRTIAQFLNSLISNLNKNDRHHREIFEGVLFVLMERVGKLLFHCTFDRHRSATVEGDIALPPVKNNKSVMMESETEATAIRLEALSLITILERLMGLAPYHMNSPLSSGSSTAKNRRTSGLTRTSTIKSLTPASRVPLSAYARDRLQRTLIKCMFGEEDRDEFSDVLRMPATLGTMPSIAKVEDKDVGEWFSGEVWKLIGWDLLSKEDEW